MVIKIRCRRKGITGKCDTVLTLLNVLLSESKFSGSFKYLSDQSSRKVAASHGHYSCVNSLVFKILALLFQSNLLRKDIHVIRLNVLSVRAAT